MVRLMSILSFAAVLVCLALATTADAQNPSPALPPPPLTCTISANTVRVDAVTDAAGNFPVAAKCPADQPGTLNCFKWSYRYNLLSGNNISLSAVTVDSDVAIVAATSGNPEGGGGMKVYSAGESDSAIGLIGNNAFDFRTVRFAAQGAVVLGHVYTKRDVGIGSVTVISKVGNQGPTTCQIAGADNIDADSVGFSPVITSTQIDQFDECKIELVLDAKGCTSDVLVSSPSNTCTVSEETTINGKAILGGPCNKPSALVVEGSTCLWYCPTSSGTCFKVCK
jgi:hypothetical protein